MNVGGAFPVKVPCALCGSHAYTAQYPLTFGAIVRCDDCGFCYVNPRMPSAHLLDKLQQWAEQDVVDPERLRIAYDPRTLSLYTGYLKRMAALCPPGRLLDIGCSSGAFMHAAQQQGWSTEGLEIGRASARHAAEKLGVPVHQGSLYDFDAAPGSYDAIVFLEVIEHLEYPLGALARIEKWLRPGGVLLVSTPNYDSLYRRLFGTCWWVVNCEDEHIQFFNRQSLEKALAQHHLQVRWTRIRGLDLAGMMQSWRARQPGAARMESADTEAQDYYAARSRKEAIKSVLADIGLLRLARGALSAIDWATSLRHSPAHAIGEQLVMLTAKLENKP